MTFALCPKDGPPRLLRFATLEGNLLSFLDEVDNVLLIDRAKYERLGFFEQHELIRTQAKETYLRSLAA